MFSLDFFVLKARTHGIGVEASRLANLLEWLFFIWISAVSALTFLISLVLTIMRVVSWMQLFYIYVGISGLTLVFAFSLYAARRNS